MGKIKGVISIVLLSALFFSCDSTEADPLMIDSKSVSSSKTFSIQEKEGTLLVKTGKKPSSLDYSFRISQSPSKVVILNTTAVDYLYQIGMLKNALAITDFRAISKVYPPRTFDLVKNIANDDLPSVEQLLSWQPDLVILNEYQYHKYEKIASQINFLVMFEYLEEDIKGRLAYINLFGAIFNKIDESNQYYNQEVERLNHINIELKESILQLDYFSGSYYVPNCNSFLSSFYESKNVNFTCSSKQQDNAITKEKALYLAKSSDVFLVFDWEKNRSSPWDILNSWHFPIPNNKGVVYCNTTKHRYYELSVTRPSLFINDFIEVMNRKKDGKYFTYFNTSDY